MMGCGCGGSSVPAPPVNQTAQDHLQTVTDGGSDYWTGPVQAVAAEPAKTGAAKE